MAWSDRPQRWARRAARAGSPERVRVGLRGVHLDDAWPGGEVHRRGAGSTTEW